MPTVDNLDIEISASVSKANASLDLLVKRLGKVSASLSGVNTRGLATLGSGVNKLSNAMSNFSNNTNTAVFSRLTRNLNSLGNIDQNAIANASKSLGKIAGAMKVFNNINVSDNAKQLGDLAKGISQLGYKSSTQAIQNIPELAKAMRNLMQTLSTAPKVSQNLIDMTNALAKLSRTGASSGRAATSLGKSLNFFSKSAKNAKTRSFSLAGAIGKLYATYWLLFRAFSKFGESLDIASDLQEVENVINKTFGDYRNLINEFASTSLENFGLTELDAKQIAGRFQAMGMAMGFAQGKMAEMSIGLTSLAADMASFYNVEQADVAKSLQAVFTGETEPLRKYGLDLTQATLKEWALTQGLNANISAMSQAEKTMLRYQYVMANTEMIQGDFADTINTWHNQLVIAKGSLQELMRVAGNIGINFLKPLVSAFNSAMQTIIQFAVEVQNALGKIFGWTVKYTPGGIASDYEDAADGASDLADGTGKAAENAKKLKQQLQGIDELNVLTTPNDTSTSGGSGSGTTATGTDATTGTWSIEETEALYESQIDTLYKLGEYIGNTLTKAMNNIDWNSVYESARNFGSGLASFLNGLISPELFGATGRTIAGALNTAIYTALSFGETFDWSDLGLSISTGINEFFRTFDFGALAQTINTWVHGIEDALITGIANLDTKEIFKGLTEFLTELDLDVVMLAIGTIAWKYKGAEIAINALGSVLSSEVATGIGSLTVSKGVALGLTITTAIVGFKIGNKLYEEIPAVQEMADSLVEWMFDGGEEINVGKAIGITLTGLTISVASAGIVSTIKTAITTAITTASAEASLAGTGVGAVILGKISTAITGAGTALSSLASTVWGALGSALTTATSALTTLGSTIVTGIGTALSSIGTFLTSSVSTVFAGGAASIAGGLFAAIGAAIAGWNIGQLIYDKFSEQIDAIVFAVGDFFTQTIPNAISQAGGAIINFGVGIGTTVQEFYTNHIKPLIDGVKDKAINLKVNITEGVKKTIDKIKTAWNELKSAVKKKLTPKISLTDSISSKLEKIKNLWNYFKDNVKLKLSATFNDNFTGAIKRAWNKIATSINGFLDKIPVVGGKIPDLPTFAGYATGGFPEDGWFRASQGEIMGKFDNGQSVVANNMQITQGISDAVYQGNRQMVSYLQQEVAELRQQNEYLRTIANKEFGITEKQIGQASQRFARDYSNRTGKPAYI